MGGDLYIKRDNLVIRQNEIINAIQTKRAELIEISATSLPLANLEVLVDKWWRNAWTLEGVKSSQCGGDTPYLFEEAASTVRTYKMRLIFENSLEQNFEVNSIP